VLAQRAAWEGPRWTRAVEDQSAPIPEEIASELGGIIRTDRSVERSMRQLGSSQPPPSEKVGVEAHQTLGVVESGSQHRPRLAGCTSVFEERVRRLPARLSSHPARYRRGGVARLSPLLAQRAPSEGWGGKRPGALLARRTRTVKLCSFDARSKGQSWPLP
jgi:hypothetical protein